MIFPAMLMPLPIVKAATIVPIPRPSICLKKYPVINAVVKRHVTSNPIFIFEYLTPVISAISRGNKSVGTIGS